MPIQQMFLGLGSKSEAEETISSTTTDLVLATLFGNDWTADIPKILNVNSGVTVGGTSGNAAILVSTGLVNTLVINNSGTITGHGGAAGSGSGPGTSLVVVRCRRCRRRPPPRGSGLDVLLKSGKQIWFRIMLGC